jgi:hypothetical protein
VRTVYALILIFEFCFAPAQIEIRRNNIIPFDSTLELPDSLISRLANYKIIMIGEMHGTQEPVRFFTQLVSKLSARKKIIAGYEIPGYLFSLKKEEINDSSLRKQKCFQFNTDGRFSTSWYESILALSKKTNVEFLFFDISFGQDPHNRDSAMFLNIRNKYLMDTSVIIVTITGNVHNKLIPHKNSNTLGCYLRTYLTPSILSMSHHYNNGSMYNNFGQGLKINHVNDEAGVYKTLHSSANYFYIFGKDDKWSAWNSFLYTEKINASFPIKNK